MFRLFLLSLLFPFALGASESDAIKRSVVKIYTVYKKLNYLEPWNVSVHRANGSGAIIEGNRILTNAHVVANSTFIEVKHSGETMRYKARVLAVSHQADLALLEVDDVRFFKNTKALKFDDLPQMQQKVSIFGFPAGGTTLSISEGIVSRIEHFRYKHSGEPFLGIQVDAAINPGNSGGPAVSEGKIIGVVMQNLPHAQNIGYLVPTPIIRHFLKDLEDGSLEGFAALGIVTENLQNPAIRAYYGLKEDQSGELITYLTYNENDQGLHVGDIITSIDGHNIENDGTVNFRGDAYTDMKYYLDLHQIGEAVLFDVIRDGKSMKVSYTLKHQINELLLVKILQYDIMPTYCIFGGYIFAPLTRNLLESTKNTPMRLSRYTRMWPSMAQKEVVVMIKVLADETNRGNHGVTFWPIETFNDTPLVSFEHFKSLVASQEEGFINLKDDDGYQIIIDVKTARAKKSELLHRYNIAKACSDGEIISAD